jgi:hypothetical protein
MDIAYNSDYQMTFHDLTSCDLHQLSEFILALERDIPKWRHIWVADDKLRKEHGVQWVSINEIPPLYSDHNEMIMEALRLMRQKIKTEPISFRLLPSLFTLTQLQRLYEAVNGEEVDKRNFRKRIKDMDFIEKTELIDKSSSKRGAYLYRFNKKAYNESNNFKL